MAGIKRKPQKIDDVSTNFMIYRSPLCSFLQCWRAHFSAMTTVVSLLLIDMITIPKTVFVKVRSALLTSAVSFYYVLDLLRTKTDALIQDSVGRSQAFFLIFLPNKFIFNQVQIHGLHYWVDTSSVFGVGLLTWKIFCVIRKNRKGDGNVTSHVWPMCQLEFQDITCLDTTHLDLDGSKTPFNKYQLVTSIVLNILGVCSYSIERIAGRQIVAGVTKWHK